MAYANNIDISILFQLYFLFLHQNTIKMKNTRIKISVFLCFILSAITTVWGQSDDFTTWTNFKVKYKIDSRLDVSGKLELRTKDDMNMLDRWGVAVGGDYRLYSFLKLNVGYETHLRNLGDSEWKFRYRYHFGATASFRYQWLKISLRERFQQTFDRGESESRLRSRIKIAYAPSKGIVSPYFSLEMYQSLDDASFWRAARMRYRPGVEIDLAECWKLDAFYCYQYESHRGKHIAGIEVAYSF